MRYDLGYWNIKKILPYQRNFNFINSTRNDGKSYTCAGFVIERWLKKKEEFLFVVRTKDEKKGWALKGWFEKVLFNEYPELPVKFTTDNMYYAPTDKKDDWQLMGHCRALSEYIQVKKVGAPRVKWMIMDEYMLEPKDFDKYVKSFHEPDIFLNMYHSVDREEDRVICFLFGNNTTFYNPYHIHEAFQIPEISEGEIWLGKNILFQWFKPGEELEKKKAECKFNQMIKGTSYGNYAVQGNYSDNKHYIRERPNRSTCMWSFASGSDIFGIWSDKKNRCIIISEKFEPSGFIFQCDGEAIEGRILVKAGSYFKEWLRKQFFHNLIFYENMRVKVRAEKIIKETIK